MYDTSPESCVPGVGFMLINAEFCLQSQFEECTFCTRFSDVWGGGSCKTLPPSPLGEETSPPWNFWTPCPPMNYVTFCFSAIPLDSDADSFTDLSK